MLLLKAFEKRRSAFDDEPEYRPDEYRLKKNISN
jgi:hypothetical protein